MNATEKAEHEAEEERTDQRRRCDFQEFKLAWTEYPIVCRQLQVQKDATTTALNDGGCQLEGKLCAEGRLQSVQASLASLVKAANQNEAMLMTTARKLKGEVCVHDQCACALCVWPVPFSLCPVHVACAFLPVPCVCGLGLSPCAMCS